MRVTVITQHSDRQSKTHPQHPPRNQRVVVEQTLRTQSKQEQNNSVAYELLSHQSRVPKLQDHQTRLSLEKHTTHKLEKGETNTAHTHSGRQTQRLYRHRRNFKLRHQTQGSTHTVGTSNYSEKPNTSASVMRTASVNDDDDRTKLLTKPGTSSYSLNAGSHVTST